MGKALEKIRRIADLLAELSILGVVFLIPVFFGYLLQTSNAVDLNKIVLFKILVLLIIFFSFIKLIINVSGASFRNFHIPGKYFFLLIPPAFYLILMAVFSGSPFISREELYYRCQGPASLAFYILFFLLAILNIRKIEQVKRIITAAFLSSLIVSAYGLAQIFGFDFIDWEEPPIATKRIFSTLGQPNFLASYLLLVMPLGAYLFFSAKKFLIKLIIFVGVLINLSAFYFTSSRGGLIGLCGAVIAGLLFYFLFFKDRSGKIYARGLLNSKKIITLIILILAALILIISKDNFFSFRLKSITDFSSGSSAVRVNIFKASIQAIKERPIFGYGPESQQNVLAKYYKKDWGLHERVNAVPDRAHNLFLDILLTSGIAGLLLYLVFLFFLFKLAVSNIRSSKSWLLSFFILSGLIGYLISLLSSFSVVSTDIYFWLYFSLLFAINSDFTIGKYAYSFNKISGEDENLELSGAKNKNKAEILFLAVKILMILILGALIFHRIDLEVKKIIADHYFFELKRANFRNEPFKALELFGYIENLGIEDNYYKKEFGLMAADLLREEDPPLYRRQSEKILEKILTGIKDKNFYVFSARAKIYTGLATEKKPDYYDLAEENFNKAIALGPEITKTYYDFANMHLKKRDFKKAEENYFKSLDFLPDTSDERMNLDHRRLVNFEKYLIYKKLGELELKRNNYKKAGEYYKSAFDNKNDDILLYRKIADTYYLSRDLEKAIWYNKRGMTLSPTDYVWPLSVALLYEEAGNKEKAKEYALKVLVLNKENEEAKRIMGLK
jgi:putative inorganic carbon (HCO3(-)) transporter